MAVLAQESVGMAEADSATQPVPRPLPAIETADPAAASAAAILTVDQEALFQQSAWGVRARAELEAEGARIQAENQRLFDQLSAEEAELARLRSEMEPAAFRERAEAFDSRATQVRRERAQVVTDLNEKADADRSQFYRAALPIMGRLMQERGAVAVLDRRTVFVSVQAIDITSDLIARLDVELGDGSNQLTPHGMSAPEPADNQNIPTPSQERP